MNDSNWIVVFGIASALGATFAACHKDEIPAWEAEVDAGVALKASRLADDPESVAELTWLFGRDTGQSSKTIFCVLSKQEIYRELTHVRLGGRGHLPNDSSDFGRCHRLLELFPAWRDRLPEVAECFPEWKPLVESWERLTALYLEELPAGTCPKLYREIKRLTGKSLAFSKHGQ